MSQFSLSNASGILFAAHRRRAIGGTLEVMDDVTKFLPAQLGGGTIWPGLIMPAAILLVALFSAATLIVISGLGGADKKDGDSGPRSGA